LISKTEAEGVPCFRLRCFACGREKQAGIPWADIEKMLRHYGAELSERRGSRVRIALNGVRAVFHRPHPQRKRIAVRSPQ